MTLQTLFDLVTNLRKLEKKKIIGYILTPVIIGFFILKNLNKKIDDIKEEIKLIKKDIIQEIQLNLYFIAYDYRKITEDDTYLIYSIKSNVLNHCDNHLKQLKSLCSYWKYFDSELQTYIQDSIRYIENIKERINSYNLEFVERRKKEYNYLFEKVGFGLDDNQKIAIIKDDKHNLVVAGAGSGKTEVLTTRIAYLIERKDKVNPKRILALAFQSKAKDEMINRLQKRYGLDVKIKTFHALGLEILQLEKERAHLFDPSEEEIKTRKLINHLFNEAMDAKDFSNEVINYLKSRDPGYIEKKTEFASDEEKEEFYEYMRSLRWRTLDNSEVKSIAERDIMNFFLTHKINGKDIKILYEEPADWAQYINDDGRWKSPSPDFFLPDFNVYIEHWALDKNNKVPDYFKSQTKYIQTMKIKKNRFGDLNYNKNMMYSLIETYNWEFYEEKDFLKILEDRLLKNLKEKNQNEDFKITPIDHDELIEKVWNMCKIKKGTITENIWNFIKNAKIYGLTATNIEERLKSGKWSPMQKIFGRIAFRIYRDYEDFLKSESKIDFQDMINLCINSLEKNLDRFRDSFDHILIDEYQDISKQRYILIKKLMDRNPNCKLFCVGDDWQSIMGFAGSNLKYFVRFGDYFDHEERTDLIINYRNIKTIVDAGANLIKNNKCGQIDKRSIANNKKKKLIIVNASRHKPDYYQNYFEHITEHCIYYIENLLKNGYKSDEITIMTRILNNPLWENLIKYSEEKGIRFWSVHKFKGLQSRIVILMDATKGLYGFPCELEDSLLFEPAREEEKIHKEDEERRLFYVALTRAKEELIIYSQLNNESKFIKEIESFIDIQELVY